MLAAPYCHYINIIVFLSRWKCPRVETLRCEGVYRHRSKAPCVFNFGIRSVLVVKIHAPPTFIHWTRVRVCHIAFLNVTVNRKKTYCPIRNRTLAFLPHTEILPTELPCLRDVTDVEGQYLYWSCSIINQFTNIPFIHHRLQIKIL
jgi:hypothetical protein